MLAGKKSIRFFAESDFNFLKKFILNLLTVLRYFDYTDCKVS